jgi:hypothetical protein
MSNEVTPYVSINRILGKLRRDYGTVQNISESDMIEWAAEALEAIGAITLYEEAVAFIEVRNHQAELPNGLHAIVQIARNTCWDDITSCGACPSDVIQSAIESNQTTSQNTNPIPVALNCDGEPINEYELAYYRPYYDMRNETGYYSNSYLFNNCFSVVRLSNHTFFNSLVCQHPEGEKLYSEGSGMFNEYTIINGDTLRLSFEKGQVAVSYVRVQVDDDGYPMMPDHYSYTTAVTKYIIYKLMEREFYSNREGAVGKLQKAEQDWHWYCKQARNRAMMPKGVDQWQNILEQRQYLLPRNTRYYGYFGKMSRPESRKFDDPDFRNYFRGYYNRYI